MISFKEWVEEYKKILQELSLIKTDDTVANLLEELNDLIRSYDNLDSTVDSEKFTTLDNLIVTLDKLLKEVSIKNMSEILKIIQDIHAKTIKEKKLLLTVIAQDIECAIDENNSVDAKDLLSSQIVEQNKTEISQYLLQVYCGTSKNETSSILAIQLLSEIRADFDSYDYKCDTPLLNVVVQTNKVLLMKGLIDAGADVDKGREQQNKENPLYFAACAMHAKYVELLLSHGADAKKSFNVLLLLTNKEESEDNLKSHRAADFGRYGNRRNKL